MKRVWVLTLVVLALSLAVCAQPQTANLTGTWRVTGPQPSKPTTMILVDTAHVVSGTFTADSGEGGIVTGQSAGTVDDGTVSLHVMCERWGMHMTGNLELDGSEVQGIHHIFRVMYGPNEQPIGKFKMVKIVCWLPEGCSK